MTYKLSGNDIDSEEGLKKKSTQSHHSSSVPLIEANRASIKGTALHAWHKYIVLGFTVAKITLWCNICSILKFSRRNVNESVCGILWCYHISVAATIGPQAVIIDWTWLEGSRAAQVDGCAARFPPRWMLFVFQLEELLSPALSHSQTLSLLLCCSDSALHCTKCINYEKRLLQACTHTLESPWTPETDGVSVLISLRLPSWKAEVSMLLSAANREEKHGATFEQGTNFFCKQKGGWVWAPMSSLITSARCLPVNFSP